MVEIYGMVGLMLGAIALGTTGGLTNKVMKLERKLKNIEDGKGGSDMIKEKLKECVNKDVKLKFYEDNNNIFGNITDKIIFSMSSIKCEVLDYDDDFVLVNAKYPKKKEPIESKFLLPLDNIKSIIVKK